MNWRENELHKPMMWHDEYIEKRGKGIIPAIYVQCYICGRGLAKVPESIKDINKVIPNYCPNCGARLKEINK